MRIVVIALPEMQKEFQEKGIAEGVEVHLETSTTGLNDDFDGYFYLLPENDLFQNLENLRNVNKPVFVNAVITTLDRLGESFTRINGWPTFIERGAVEIAGHGSTFEQAKTVLQSLGWNFTVGPDIPGIVAARIISMIVNEAYFALGDNVSTKDEIDIAMKLGTNYPYGPFEWSERIGLQNIASLLQQISKTDKRYTVAPALLKDLKITE